MKVINYIILLTLSITFLFFYSNGNVEVAEKCTLCLLLFNIIYSIQNLRRRFVFFAFQVTFAVFLLGQNIADLFSIGDHIFGKAIEEEFPIQLQLHVYSALFVSLAGFFIGYSLTESKKEGIPSFTIDLNSQYILKLRSFSKKLMYLFSIFALAVSLEKAIFVQATGYLDYYTDFASFLPSFVYRFETLYELSLYLFLATFPRIKECRPPLILYVSIGIISLGSGQRNGFVLGILFIGIYYSIRHTYKVYGNSENWINRKKILAVAIALPFMIFFLYVFGSSRADLKAETYNHPWNNFLAFFYQQGGSSRLIGYEKNFSDLNHFPKDVPPYTFGYIIDLYQQNALFKALDVYPEYPPLSKELALKGHNFSQTITYLYRPDYYFMGIGLGSCYIAEVHHDFGMIGVFIINILYGIIIALLYKYAIKNVWGFFFCLLTTMYILYAPRAQALFFINQILAPSTILYLIVILITLRKYRHKLK